MRIALYSRPHNCKDNPFITSVLKLLSQYQVQLIAHENLQNEPFMKECPLKTTPFSTYEDLKALSPIDFIISFGGDGSFIDAANLVADLQIPVVGVNTGRIGFLTVITKKNFEAAIEALINKDYEIEKRSLLHIEADQQLPFKNLFAVNDVTIRPSDETSINGILVWVNGVKVNTYWADGLIIATPTGSTAYSLSCGGPIIHPSAQVHVITPISSHTLAVRPIVVQDQDRITIRVQSRSNRFLLSLDSTRYEIENPCTLTITKEAFSIQTPRFFSSDYFSVIREKLMWGIDLRNVNENH